MERYRVTLTIHEAGSMSKEDFRKLQAAVDQIASVTELSIFIDSESFNKQEDRELIRLIPNNASQVFLIGDMQVVEQMATLRAEKQGFKPMETGKHNGKPFKDSLTLKEIYGQE